MSSLFVLIGMGVGAVNKLPELNNGFFSSPLFGDGGLGATAVEKSDLT
jgi:hypothetical protein